MNKPLKPSEMIVEGKFKRIDHVRPNTYTASQPAHQEVKEKGVSRRGFLGTSGKLIAGAAVTASVGYPVLKYNTPQPYDLALLKMDTKQNALALEHRTCATGDTEASIEPTKASFEGLDARTLARDGHQSMVISPELCIGAQDGGAQNINRRDAKINGCPENLYIPYHLFADARMFDVRVKKNRDGEWKLCIEIAGVPEASKVPILKAVPRAVAQAAEDAGTGVVDAAQSGWAWIKDQASSVFGGSDGSSALEAVQQEHHERDETFERTRPHPQTEALFQLQMDFVPGRVPNLIFFNGKTLDNPSYVLRGSKIEDGIRADTNFNFPIIPNDGLSYTTGIGQDGVGVPIYKTPYKFFDRALAEKVENSRLLADSTPKAGYLPEILHYLSDKALHDDKINGYEMGALAISARTQQKSLDEIGKEDVMKKLNIRFNREKQPMDRLPSEIPGAMSR